jgi:capsular polysaccharide biosynthesis protein
LEIGKLQQDIGKIENEMRSYQQRIERTPKREGELIALKRDYDNIQNTYRSLLNRKLEANIAVNLEKKKKGEQFRILDYAKLPEKPVSPDIRDIFLKSLLGGLGIGTAIIVLFQFLDPSIQRKENIVELGVPLLVTIPKIYNDRAKMLRRVNNIASLFSVVVAGLLATGFAIVALSGIML